VSAREGGFSSKSIAPFWNDKVTQKVSRLDDGRRAQFRAELDAYYARLYGLTRDELRYTLLASTPKKSTAKISLAKHSAC
jgi:hypothetical protein